MSVSSSRSKIITRGNKREIKRPENARKLNAYWLRSLRRNEGNGIYIRWNMYRIDTPKERMQHVWKIAFNLDISIFLSAMFLSTFRLFEPLFSRLSLKSLVHPLFLSPHRSPNKSATYFSSDFVRYFYPKWTLRI